MKINYYVDQNINVRAYLESFYLSKSKAYKLLADKAVMLNDKILDERYNLSKGDIISINYNEKIDYEPEDIKLDILFEDDYFLIINKMPNLIIHDDNNSLCNAVANYYKKNNIDLNVRFAHRLDKDTTGVIVFVKCPLALAYMNHFIETHEIRREYIALVNGIFKNKKGTINYNIGEDRHIQNKKRVSKTGKSAITHYEVIKEINNNSLIRVKLETGRTHQIRCHMEAIGHPLIGDKLYGDKSNLSNRYLLHSERIAFIHPFTKKKIEVIAKLPDDFIK